MSVADDCSKFAETSRQLSQRAAENVVVDCFSRLDSLSAQQELACVKNLIAGLSSCRRMLLREETASIYRKLKRRRRDLTARIHAERVDRSLNEFLGHDAPSDLSRIIADKMRAEEAESLGSTLARQRL